MNGHDVYVTRPHVRRLISNPSHIMGTPSLTLCGWRIDDRTWTTSTQPTGPLCAACQSCRAGHPRRRDA